MTNPIINNVTATHPGSFALHAQESESVGNCRKCGTELKFGAEFCHVCGRWVYGSNLSWFARRTKEALSQTGLEIPSLLCMIVAAVFSVISVFVGLRFDPKTIGEWQIIQFWRIEWLLGAIVVLLFGLLLKEKR